MAGQVLSETEVRRWAADLFNGALTRIEKRGVPGDLLCEALLGAAVREAATRVGPEATAEWLRNIADFVAELKPEGLAAMDRWDFPGSGMN